MDVSLLIRNRLDELGLEQKDLASAVQVTESYVSQLLSRKKAPPAPGRTDLYDKISDVLKLPKGELSKLAAVQRQEELKKKVTEPPKPLFKEFRDLILRKCDHRKRNEIARIFGQQPFGELERLITQKLLDVAQGIAREELRNERWLRRMAKLTSHSYEQIRVAILEFLETDVYNVSAENCVSFLDPMIDAWDMDLSTFGLEIALSRRLAPERMKRFAFAEELRRDEVILEPGLQQFLKDASLSKGITEEEIDFLRRLKFEHRKPTAFYYYRELQSLRDPLHFGAKPQGRKRG